MASSLIVLRTSALLLLLLAVITGLYVGHVTRMAADGAAQAAATAAAHVAVAEGWPCGPNPPGAAVTAAVQASLEQMEHLAVQPVAVDVAAEGCNLVATVTAVPLDARVSALQTTAVACRAATGQAPLSVPGSC